MNPEAPKSDISGAAPAPSSSGNGVCLLTTMLTWSRMMHIVSDPADMF